MRILHAPTAVGGHSHALSRAERELGLQSDVVTWGDSPYGFGSDISLPEGGGPLRLVRGRSFVRKALDEYDVFHFNFGRTLAGFQAGGRAFSELPLLKRKGKTVIVTFQGCDVRPPSRCFCGKPECHAQADWRRRNADELLRHADRVFFVNPDLREWLPGGRFVPYAVFDPRSVEPVPFREGEEVVVAHAPTDRNVKGTAHVEAAVEALRADGVPVRLDLLEGMRREQVMERMARADLVVDQLLIGWYGGISVEAMAMGKPVLCFIREEVPEDNPFGSELPILRTSPQTLADDLRSAVGDPALRREAGEAGRRFALRHHDPRQIARTYLEGIVELPDRPEPVPA